jgi:thioredoxin-related protein
MKKIIVALVATVFLAGAFAFTIAPKNTPKPAEIAPVGDGIKWITWEQAVELNKTKPKKFMVDVFTEWCGWCKRMDKDIFTDAKVAQYVAENYYAVKFDAEQKPEVTFNGKVFKFVGQGNRGYHEFAATLLDGNMGYPTIVYLSETFERTVVSPGYKDAPTLMKELKFTAEEHYKKGTWDDYMSKSK